MAGKASAHLQRWYLRQWTADWIHEWGVRIETLSNPGWSLEINLEGTDLERRSLAAVSDQASDLDWVHYESDGLVFRGACGPLNLERLLSAFTYFAEAVGDREDTTSGSELR